MSERVIIDPHMFEINACEEVDSALDFFRKIVVLCKHKIITIGVYKTLYNDIISRETNPFPIALREYKNPEQKKKILDFNKLFIENIMPNLESLDIEECLGTQDFESNYTELEENNLYYEMFAVLLRKCYFPDIVEEKIIICEKNTYLSANKMLNIRCECERQFEKVFHICSVDSFLPNKLIGRENLLLRLREICGKQQEKIYVDAPEVVRGDHHNLLQKKEISVVTDLSRKNKRVLALLRYFGLKKVVFERYWQETKHKSGDIYKCKLKSEMTHDIVKGQLYGELGYVFEVSLYFPIDVGKYLCESTDGIFEYHTILELKDTTIL